MFELRLSDNLCSIGKGGAGGIEPLNVNGTSTEDQSFSSSHSRRTQKAKQQRLSGYVNESFSTKRPERNQEYMECGDASGKKGAQNEVHYRSTGSVPVAAVR